MTDQQFRAMVTWFVVVNLLGLAVLAGVIVYVATLVWG